MINMFALLSLNLFNKGKLNKRALGPLVAHLRMTDQWSGTICEILVECIMRNNSVNYIEVGSDEMSYKRFLVWSSAGPPVQWSETIYAILKEGIIGNIYVKLYEIWTSSSEGDVV